MWGEIMEKIFTVKGMHCKSCEVLLSDVIGEIKGIDSVSADHKEGKVSVIYSDENALSQAKKAIQDEGYEVLA